MRVWYQWCKFWGFISVTYKLNFHAKQEHEKSLSRQITVMKILSSSQYIFDKEIGCKLANNADFFSLESMFETFQSREEKNISATNLHRQCMQIEFNYTWFSPTILNLIKCLVIARVDFREHNLDFETFLATIRTIGNA